MDPRLMRPKRRGPTVPGAPRIIAASESEGLQWSPPANTGGSAIIEYRLYENGILLDAVGGDQTTWFNPPSPGNTYTVSAVNVVGEGPQSPPAIAV
jgi:hypothetical protein